MSGLFRFLRPERFDPFIGTAWPPEGWVAAPAGVVVYAADALPRWLAHELWVVELDGTAAPREFSVVAPRARLARRVEAWDRTCAADLVRSILERHPGVAGEPSGSTWPAVWETAYVAAHTAGMDAEASGRDYAAAETAEWAAQARWLRERLELA